MCKNIKIHTLFTQQENHKINLFSNIVTTSFTYKEVYEKLNKQLSISDIKRLMKYFHLSLILKHPNILLYTPKNHYKFKILDNHAELYINNVLFNITDDTVLNIDVKEMIYGIFPTIKYTIAKYIINKDGIPPQFINKPCYIYKDTKLSNLSLQACAFLHLLLFYKKVVNATTIRKFLIKYTNKISKDAAHAYRGLTEHNCQLYIIKNKNNEFINHSITKKYPMGSYCLFDIIENKPVKTTDRNILIDNQTWENIKKQYNYQCQICGAIENKPHILYPTSITTLEKGHIKPYLPLSEENCITHCQYCNRTIKNNYILEQYKHETALYINFAYLSSIYNNEWITKLKNLLNEKK